MPSSSAALRRPSRSSAGGIPASIVGGRREPSVEAVAHLVGVVVLPPAFAPPMHGDGATGGGQSDDAGETDQLPRVHGTRI